MVDLDKINLRFAKEVSEGKSISDALYIVYNMIYVTAVEDTLNGLIEREIQRDISICIT